MNNQKILILRTVPIANFKIFFEHFKKDNNFNNCDIMIQEDLKDKINLNVENLNVNYIYIKPGKFNFFKGLKNNSFFKYDEVIIPVNSYEIEDYLNLFFFVLPIISKSYSIYNPSFAYEKYSYLLLFLLTIILELLSYLILVLIFPFYLLFFLFLWVKNYFNNKY